MFRALEKMHSWVLSVCCIVEPSLEALGTRQMSGGGESGAEKGQGQRVQRK